MIVILWLLCRGSMAQRTGSSGMLVCCLLIQQPVGLSLEEG